MAGESLQQWPVVKKYVIGINIFCSIPSTFLLFQMDRYDENKDGKIGLKELSMYVDALFHVILNTI